MKRFLIMCVSALSLFVLSACGGADTGNASSKDSNEKSVAVNSPAGEKKADEIPSGKKVLVAYFSCTGNTKSLAEHTAKVLSAELYEIRPEIPYSAEDLNYNDEGTRATVEQKDDNARPALADMDANIAAYDTIVLAYPIWWGQAPRILDTFVESYDFTGKTIVPICTSGGSDMGSSADYLKRLMKGNANWKQGRLFSGHASESELMNWFSGEGL